MSFDGLVYKGESLFLSSLININWYSAELWIQVSQLKMPLKVIRRQVNVSTHQLQLPVECTGSLKYQGSLVKK